LEEDVSVNDKIALITGVGPGTGAALARRFAQGGYRVAMLARDEERLAALQSEIPAARAFACDVTDTTDLGRVLDAVEAEIGSPTVLVHNAVGGAFGETW
jgi:NADP-dependent 3-hydroxy acid dehydrogenase YdfG